MEIVFDEKKMKKFIERDLLLKKMYEGLGGDKRALKAVFHSEVLGDSVMEEIYQEL